MAEPKYWNSIFAARLIKAFDAGETTLDKESIRTWLTKYGSPEHTVEEDLDAAKAILFYYAVGHKLDNREGLEKAIALQDKIKADMEGSDGKVCEESADRI